MGAPIKRRSFITLLGGAAAAWPLAARAQQQGLPVIGFLNGQSPAEFEIYLAAFRAGLGETGYVEHRNVGIEYRWAQGQYDRLPAFAADLVRSHVAVIVATGATAAVFAAKAATTTIPIVFSTATNPAQFGIVSSFNRPGGNVTGVTFTAKELAAKRLELLHGVVPRATKIGFLVNTANPGSEIETNDAREAARVLGLGLEVQHASSEREIDAAFAKFVEQRVDALLVSADGFYVTRRDQLIKLAALHKLPASYTLPEHVAAGGLMSYGASQKDAYRQVGIYTGRVLKGEKPADLPVMQPTKFEFVINLQTARTLGIEVPPGLLAISDEVIE